jgi:excisionase family DNA binding protein
MPARAVSQIPEEDEWLTYEEAAVHARVSFRTITSWVAKGHIPATRTGPRAIRVSKAGLDRYMTPRAR